MLTGEPVPVAKHPGDHVVGGTVNQHMVSCAPPPPRSANKRCSHRSSTRSRGPGFEAADPGLADRGPGVHAVVIAIAIVTFSPGWAARS